MNCPICKGKGKLEKPTGADKRSREREEMGKKAKALRKAGYSIRQIMKLVGCSSTYTMSNLLK